MMSHRVLLPASLALLVGCASQQQPPVQQSQAPQSQAAQPPSSETAPPPNIQAWMDRLTVAHAYDPTTGFIVAKEVVTLPPPLAEGPSLDDAVAIADREGRTLIVFATADRCAPCQQFKRDALNDPRVVARLGDPSIVATHVEVDREPDAATRILGSRGIPVTYALRDGRVVARLPGQRSADAVIAFIDGL
jgi:hypothetical protein